MTIKTFTNIGNQLESLLSELTYPVIIENTDDVTEDNDENTEEDETEETETPIPVFKNVLLGFPETDFRGFEFPLAVCYVKGGEYDDTFGIRNMPRYLKSVIGVVVTGDTRSRYEKITEIMDIIQTQFHDNDDWIKLNGTVRRTFIEDSALTIMPTGNDLASVAIFTLRHHVFKIE